MQYTPFASDIELPFYTSLASHKINHDKLDDSARKLLGLYEIKPTDAPEASCRMQIRGNALTSDEVPAAACRAEGIIKNVNTIEEYKNLDKATVLHRAGRIIWEAINDGTIYSCPSLLAAFSVISFADLKRYRFTYWFAFPALHSDPPWKLDDSRPTVSGLSKQETQALVEKVQTWRYSVDTRQHGFFLAKKVRVSSQGELNENAEDGEDNHEHFRSSSPGASGEEANYVWAVAPLGGYESGFFKDVEPHNRFVCFADPSTYAKNPGWMLRNLLVLIQRRWQCDRVQILCYRDVQSRRDDPKSIILNLMTEGTPAALGDSHKIHNRLPPMPKVTGWERNKEGKLLSKIVHLAEYMDPQRLADQSVDLNLKLMRWRIAPNLDLEKIKNTKCLLLGAGTLGSYVSRNLLGWGVRKVTFVDNANVSFSNPVRQPLFDFKDCLQGGAKKAYRASEALLEIYPGVDSSGHVFSVPMAGHPITDDKKTRNDFDLLQYLIEHHDVIFLLMDTRESRWLPTVMAKAAGKIVMNAALGFDTFVVMRHGMKLAHNRDQELGCYFCNDVVAPQDSIKDQTLDQQCTVTRPGIAAIASAMLVELLVSILQHPDGGAAPAPNSTDQDRGEHPLGLVPHQIRGFLSNFQNMTIKGRSYDCCSACSDRVVDAYRKGGFEFVQRALNEKGYVEELSGLAEVQRAAEAAAAEIEWDENEIGDDGDEDEGEGQLI
ncbi:autophagy-related protein-like protein 7 [Xylona heveae TC161]|uniref:Ubiquitin-like modifier-activating enzyme ATG7 n=1 Tax=Xylona heveae (strain CBS 132557 / TC161) TaxID=1328760 RepID=A0A165A8Y2_XYLHT|nr:autophagy-related protein-like protein 7 [Xylona heveae TC161]KZF20110.1 autophagy-related protein-like protein 7 [Xylona heveae TC161]